MSEFKVPQIPSSMAVKCNSLHSKLKLYKLGQCKHGAGESLDCSEVVFTQNKIEGTTSPHANRPLTLTLLVSNLANTK